MTMLSEGAGVPSLPRVRRAPAPRQGVRLLAEGEPTVPVFASYRWPSWLAPVDAGWKHSGAVPTSKVSLRSE
jgi:hypothetical protein